MGILAALYPTAQAIADESSVSADPNKKTVALDEPFMIDGLQYCITNIYPDYFQFSWLEVKPGFRVRGQDQYSGKVGAAFPLDFNISVFNSSEKQQESDPVSNTTCFIQSSDSSSIMPSWNFSEDVVAPQGATNSTIAYGLYNLYDSWGLQPIMGSDNAPVLAAGERTDFWLPIAVGGYSAAGRMTQWYSGYPSTDVSYISYEDGDEIVSYCKHKSVRYELILGSESDTPAIFPITVESAFGGSYFNTRNLHKIIATFDVGQTGSSHTVLMDQRSRDSWCDLTLLKPYIPILQGTEENSSEHDLSTSFDACGISLSLPATAQADIAADGHATITDETNGFAFDIYPHFKEPNERYHPSKYEYHPNMSYLEDFKQTILADDCMILGDFDRLPNNENDEGWPYNVTSFVYTQTSENGVDTQASAIRIVCNIPLIDTSVTGINCWLAADAIDAQLPLVMDILFSITRSEDIPGATASDEPASTGETTSSKPLNAAGGTTSLFSKSA